MTFLPIIGRELNVASRKPATFHARISVALVCLAVWIPLTLVGSRVSSRELGRTLFIAFGVLAFAFALLAGCLLTADCLSEEKREGTLGLLFLTPLRAYDIFLGKLVANGLPSFYGLLAVLPILSLPLLMGGVSFDAFLRVVLVLVLTLLFSLTVGMAVSVFSRETRDSMARGLFILTLFSGVLPALWWLLGRQRIHFPCVNFLLRCSPVYAYRMALDGYYFGSTKKEFWLACLMMVLFIGAALFLASFFLPHRWQDQDPRPKQRIARAKQKVVPRRLSTYANPLAWLVERAGEESSAYQMLFFLIGLVWLVALVLTILIHRAHEPFITCLFAAYAFHQVAKSFNILEATRQMSIARASGALELLLITPLTDSQIHDGFFSAIRSRCSRRNRAMLAMNGVMLVVVWCLPSPYMDRRDKGIFSEMFIGGALLGWLDFLALRAVGTWTAFTTRHHNRALIPTVGKVLLPPWGAVFILVFVMSIMRNGGAGTAALMIGTWLAFAIFWDLIIIQWAHRKLRNGFRFPEDGNSSIFAKHEQPAADRLQPLPA